MKNNIMEIFRSKKGMLILLVFILPLLFSINLGIEMKDNIVSAVPTIIVDHDKTDFSNTLTSYVKDNRSFNVVLYTDSEQEMKEYIERGDAVVGIIYPEDMYKDMRKGSSPNILVFYDTSQLHMLAFSKNTLSQIFMTAQAAFMQQVYIGNLGMSASEALNEVLPINITYTKMFNPAGSLKDYILAGLIAAIMQAAMVIMGAEAAKFKDVDNLRGHIKTIFTYGTAGSLSLMFLLFLQVIIFGMPYKGSITAGIATSWLFSVCIVMFGYIIGRMISDRVLACQISCFLVIPTSLLSDFTFPMLAMPTVMQKIVSLFPFTYYSNTLRRISLAEIGWQYIIGDLTFYAAFISVGILIVYLVTKYKPSASTSLIKEEVTEL